MTARGMARFGLLYLSEGRGPGPPEHPLVGAASVEDEELAAHV